MKRRITVALSEEIVERLEATAEGPGASKAALMEAALQRFLGTETETVDEVPLQRRLNGINRQLDQLDRDLSIVSEMVALHARYHLSITPSLPQAHQRTARGPGLGRLKAFTTQVARRLRFATPLTQETMGRLGATDLKPFASDAEEGASLGTPCVRADHGHDASPPTVLYGELESSAGVQEGASGSGFRGETHNPYR